MIYYVGSFPPPYGGVTIKNALLYEALEAEHGKGLRKLDAAKAKRKPWQLLKLLGLLLGNHTFLIGTAHRKGITWFLHRFNRKAMGRSLLLVMGGQFADLAAENKRLCRQLTCYRQIFVETASMQQTLNQAGLSNVSVLPNCRKGSSITAIRPTGESLRCLFFSRISPDKGVDLILQAAGSDLSVDLYGEIDPDYRETFLNALEGRSNLRYRGVFKADHQKLYEKLHEYDVLLFPTRWKAEGIPGILVEAKMAGLPAIVSDIRFNKEIVEDGVSGLVLPENTAENLRRAIDRLAASPALTDKLKQGALASAKNYLLETHLHTLMKWL